MSRTVKEKRARFRELHQSGCFILPNAWDVGSARMLESLGFEAPASTSTGYAWSTGRPDYAATRDDVLGHLTTLAHSAGVASGLEIARSRSEDRRAIPLAREPNTRTSWTNEKMAKRAAKDINPFVAKSRNGIGYPHKNLDLLRHSGKSRSIIVDDARVNANGQRLIVGMAGEIALKNGF